MIVFGGLFCSFFSTTGMERWRPKQLMTSTADGKKNKEKGKGEKENRVMFDV